jgi:hypothetical protein
MRRIIIGSALAFAVVLGGPFVAANAASLADPAKLCALIADANHKNIKWLQSDSSQKYWWFCYGEAHIFPTPEEAGTVWMIDYQAAGPTKTRVTTIYFKLKMYDSRLRNDQIAAQIVSRFSAIFAASNAGPVPNDLIQAINQVRTTSVTTTLGTVQTRFTPGSPDHPNNGATFEVELDAPSP